MKTIIDRIAQYIEEWAMDYASTLLVKNFGFVELVNRESRGTTKNKQNQSTVSKQPIPITIPGDGSEGTQVSLDDQFNFIFWIRLPGKVQVVENDDDSWGLKQGKRQNLDLRIVIAHRNNLGENVVYDLVEDLPENIFIQGFQFVFLDAQGEVDNDHETIHNTELGKTNYEKHRFTWNIYTINLNVQYIPCTDFVIASVDVNDRITDENGNYITVS